MLELQNKLRVPKDMRNDFGKFQYRNADQILEKAKPLLAEYGYRLRVMDDLVNIGERYYIKCMTEIVEQESGKVIETAFGWAREAAIKKGMDESQITGSASSYALKYSLAKLFALDNEDDADAMDNRETPASTVFYSMAQFENAKGQMKQMIAGGKETPASLIAMLKKKYGSLAPGIADEINQLVPPF